MPIFGKPLQFKASVSFLILLLALSCVLPVAGYADPANYDMVEVKRILESVARLEAPHERIVAISGYLLGRPYMASTLVGGPGQEERLVVNLKEFDCFTFLDIVEALSRSVEANNFADELRFVRYRRGVVSYSTRKHFFSDWVTDQPTHIVDVTQQVARDSSVKVMKQLNLRSDGDPWLPGIPVRIREVTYIPTRKVDARLLRQLRGGDYVGFFTGQPGLDVSHTGLIIKHGEQVLLRHASSADDKLRVLDEDLLSYLANHEGIVVYRVSDK